MSQSPSSGSSTPRVLIVPGALGSRLGLRGRFFDDELWLDPFDVRRGNLDMISFGPRGNPDVEVLGIMRSAYLAPKLLLTAKGFAVDFYAYDWRAPVQELGAQLAAHLASLGCPDVRFVCHSYGGLVVRSALAQGAENVTRVVTLGSPHRGAFSTVMLLRGTHPVLQRIAVLDPRGDARELSAGVFSTFPGTYHLLPEVDLQPGLDCFDAGIWPSDDPRPQPELLDQARLGLSELAPLDDRFCCLAGIGCITPRGVRDAGDRGFTYDLGTAGDSVVPIESAAPPDSRAWYVEGGHGTLPWVPAVLEALPDLVATGETERLPRKPPEFESRGSTDDIELDERFAELKKSLRRPSVGTLNDLITEYASPAPEPEPVARPTAQPGTRSQADRYDRIRAHSQDPNAYALLQPGLEYFDHGEGFLGYRTSLWRPVVLGDAVCPASQRAEFLGAFLDSQPRAVFFNLSEDGVRGLHELDRGYRFCPYGSERVLDLEDDSFLDVKKIKGALKKAKKGGLELEELDLATVSSERLEELRAINQEFLESTPAKREITFISRGVALTPEPGVRFFALRCKDGEDSRDFGFLVLDPCFSGGKKVGYQLNAIRFRRTSIWGVYFAIVARLGERLRTEGVASLSLGGLAFDLLDQPSSFPHDEKMLARLSFVRERTDEYYVMSHFTDMKLEFGGVPVRRYCAIPPSASVTRSIVRFLRVSGMV